MLLLLSYRAPADNNCYRFGLCLTASSSLKHATATCQPRLFLFRHGRYQRGRLPAHQPGQEPLSQKMSRRESTSSHAVAVAVAVAIAVTSAVLTAFLALPYPQLHHCRVSASPVAYVRTPSNAMSAHRKSVIAPCRSTFAEPIPSITSQNCLPPKRASNS